MIPAWIGEEMARFERGMALHYAFLFSAVYGMEAEAVFEFGAGWSTRAILEALFWVGRTREGSPSRLITCSTDTKNTVIKKASLSDGVSIGEYSLPLWENDGWEHLQSLSEDLPKAFLDPILMRQRFDLVLHDGSHTPEVVEADLSFILPRVKQYGLVLVHDTQHSGVGEGMRGAVAAILRDFDCTATTLPYGYGLTILRVEAAGPPPVSPQRKKVTSAATTVPVRMAVADPLPWWPPS